MFPRKRRHLHFISAMLWKHNNNKGPDHLVSFIHLQMKLWKRNFLFLNVPHHLVSDKCSCRKNLTMKNCIGTYNYTYHPSLRSPHPPPKWWPKGLNLVNCSNNLFFTTTAAGWAAASNQEEERKELLLIFKDCYRCVTFSSCQWGIIIVQHSLQELRGEYVGT